jgi:hypothetical protein
MVARRPGRDRGFAGRSAPGRADLSRYGGYPLLHCAMDGVVVGPHPPICVILNTGTSPLHRFPRRKGSPVDLSSYAELAVRLVNTSSLGHEGGDQLTTLDGLRALVADREHLNHGVSRHELEALRQLRTEFRAFFVACSQGDGADATARLNELLIQYPVHPQLSGHDGQAWHVHYTESGSMSALSGSASARRRHAWACSSTRRPTAQGGTAPSGAPTGRTSPRSGLASERKNPRLSHVSLRQDVRRLEAHQVVFGPLPLRIGREPERVAEPGVFQLVPNTAGVGEPRLSHPY